MRRHGHAPFQADSDIGETEPGIEETGRKSVAAADPPDLARQYRRLAQNVARSGTR